MQKSRKTDAACEPIETLTDVLCKQFYCIEEQDAQASERWLVLVLLGPAFAANTRSLAGLPGLTWR